MKAAIPTVYELSLVRDYVSHWGVQEAVREFLQNALDAPTTFSYTWVEPEKDEGWTLMIRSSNMVLKPRMLLLGSTTKTEGTTIGSFGEGFKIALLVLSRLDRPVIMKNGVLIWRPALRLSDRYGVETLCIDEFPGEDTTHTGLTVVIGGLTDEEKMDIIGSCIRMQENPGKFQATKYGSILLDQPGRLYCGGLFICKTELEYGYNILPKYLPLERDRQTVSDWDLGKLTFQMQMEVQGAKVVAKMVANDSPDVRMAQYYAPEEVKEECLALFREDHPDSVVASTRDEALRMSRTGYGSVAHIGGTYGSLIQSAPSYQASYSQIVPKTPQARLQAWLASWKHELSDEAITAFKDLTEEAEKWVLE